RIGEGAAMMRTKGEAGTGNVVEAVRHMRSVQKSIKRLAMLREDELMAEAKTLGAPFEVVQQGARTGKLPVPNFAAGGVATPADASLMVQLGAEAVFVGSGIFEVGLDTKAEEQRRDQLRMAKAIVKAVANFNRPEVLVEVSAGLPRAMKGLAMEAIAEDQQLAKRGWWRWRTRRSECWRCKGTSRAISARWRRSGQKPGAWPCRRISTASMRS